jgi:hypothetical protein
MARGLSKRAARIGIRLGAALVPLAVVGGLLSPVPGALAASRSPHLKHPHVAKVKPGDFGPAAARSADIAINGWGDTAGYHIDVGRPASGFLWREVAVLDPVGYDEASWTGYQCISGDGKYAAVAILPTDAVNIQAARAHGGFAYSVNLATGKVRPVAAGVALEYDSPGCGEGDAAVFTVSIGENEQATEIVNASLPTGNVTSTVTVPGQITSVVPMASSDLGVQGSDLVRIPAGRTSAHARSAVIAKVGGQPFDVRPAADGGLNFLDARLGSSRLAASRYLARGHSPGCSSSRDARVMPSLPVPGT